MYFIVYKTTNLLDGKFYIGAHRTRVLEDGYLGSGKRLRRAIKKYGVENFRREVLAFCRSERAMYALERRLIAEHLDKKECYNIHPGGKGGWGHITSKQRKPSHDLMRKRMRDPEHIAYLQERLRATDAVRRRTETWRARHAEAARSRKTFLGKTHTEETKSKIAKALSIAARGSGNSHFGTIWIKHDELEQTTRVPLEQLETLLDLGWRKGRCLRYKSVRLAPVG